MDRGSDRLWLAKDGLSFWDGEGRLEPLRRLNETRPARLVLGWRPVEPNTVATGHSQDTNLMKH